MRMLSSLANRAPALLAAAAILAALLQPAAAATVSIDFEGVALGAEATNSYVAQGVRFPSKPVIGRDFANQVLEQGGSATPGTTPTRCSPLIMELNAAMGVREVRMRAINRHLRNYHIEAYAGTVLVDIDEYRARPRSIFDPLPEPSRDVVLRAAADEGDITRVVAYPPSDCFDLMLIDDLVLTTARPVTPIDPVPVENVVSVLAYEITQGVMPRLTWPASTASTPDTRLMALPAKDLPFVKGRNTAVRFFLVGSERAEPDYDANLHISVTDRSGVVRSRTIRENTAGGHAVPHRVGSDLEQRRALVMRRAQRGLSLDFVIPRWFLANAHSATLTLHERAPGTVILARIQMNFIGPYRFGMNVWRINDIRRAETPPMGSIAGIARFLDDIFPLSAPPTVRYRGILFNDTLLWPNCAAIRGQLSAAIAGTAAASAVPGVNSWTNMFVGQSLPCGGGDAAYNAPFALTVTRPATAAHEVGHNIGMNHAGNLHGEGGIDWESWPYQHGSIGAVAETAGFNDGVFGVVLRPRLVTIDSSRPLGLWTIDPIAPCASGTAAAVFPSCATDANLMHEYMTNVGRWTSDINYYRVGRWFQTCIATDPPYNFWTGATWNFSDPAGVCTAAPAIATAASTPGAGAMPDAGAAAAPREALVFSGSVGADGAVERLIVVRKLATPESLRNPAGPNLLLLRDANGAPIASIPFNTHASADDDSPRRTFLVLAPYAPALSTLNIKLENNSVFTRQMPARAPAIVLLQPKGGTARRAGTLRIAWQLGAAAADPRATVYVQYSPDNGASWLPLGLVAAKQQHLDVQVEDLVPSEKALVYISATDGLGTVAALSTRPFALGRQAPAGRPGPAK